MLVLPACGRSGPQPFEVRVEVSADGARPLPGAQIRVGGDYMATSDARGRAALSVAGLPGALLSVAVACPEGFRAQPSEKPLELPASDATDTEQPLTITLSCETLLHDGVVLVHAAGGASHLPVKVDGVVVGQTDELGFAYVHVRASSESAFEVSLDTSGNSALAPANPGQRFELSDGDELFVFDAAFEDSKAAARKQRTSRRRARASRLQQ
jgi:hypothetical protein